MGKLIRKRTFIGNIALVIFLAFLCTVTFGAIPTSAAVTPTPDNNMQTSVDLNNRVKVLDKDGQWQNQSANVMAPFGKRTTFTVQVLTTSFDSIWMEFTQGLGRINVKDMDPGNVKVTSKVYESIYGVVYSVYQIVYTHVYDLVTNTVGTDKDGRLIVSASNAYASIILDLEGEPPQTVDDTNKNEVVDGSQAIWRQIGENQEYNPQLQVTQQGQTKSCTLQEPLGMQKFIPSLNATPVEVVIPPGTVVTGDASWNGVISAPTPKPASEVTVPSGNVQNVIEIGLPDKEIWFSKAVCIRLPGQTGKSVGWTRVGETFHEISRTLSLNTQERADAEIPVKGDAKYDDGTDLWIWTKHFTKFVTYTVSSSSSSGGGGGVSQSYVTSTTGSAKVYPSAGGSIGLGNDATVKIPAKALKGSSQVEVKVQKVASPAAAPAGWKLVSGVYDFIVGGSHSYTFDKKVSVVLKFDPKLVAEGQIPAIFNRKDGANTWTKIGGKVSGSTITAEVDHFSQFAVMVEDKAVEPVPGGLTDIKGHWAEAVIAELVEKGAISGYPDKTFKPERNMTRTEFVVVLAKAFGMQPDVSYALKFNDNSKIPAWGKAYVAAAVKAGIVKGDNLGNFNPSANVTRAEMAAMVAKAMNAKLSTAPKLTFKDQVPAWAAGAVEYLVKADVLTGYPDNTFKAGNNATRAEACTVISKAGKI